MSKFRPRFIAAAVVVWGVVTLVGELLGVKFNIYWFAILSVLLGLWVLSHPKLRTST
jgi:hypothetical protein